MDDSKLKQILQSRETAPDENARKTAVNLALAEYDAARAQRNNISQGSSFWARLTGRSNKNERREPMNRKLVYGGMATAMVVVMAAGASWQAMQTTVGQGASVLMEAPGESDITQNYEEAVKEFNVADVERALKAQDSGLPVPAGVERGRVGLEAEAPAKMAAAPVARAEQRAMSAGAAPMEMAMIAPYPQPDDVSPYYQDEGRDKFESVKINAVKQVSAEPVSTFSIDTDTASYSMTRRMINNGQLPPADAVRVEEMVNYFDYDYAVPSDKAQPFMPAMTVMDSPWGTGRKLMHVAIKGYDIDKSVQPRSNLVFLIDVSGSMNSPDKLPLLKSSMKMLLGTLKPDDTVAIVTYAGNAGTVIEPTKVSERAKIEAAIDNLMPGGGTAGAAGIEQAYKLAESSFDKDGVNRVILATDGDFNIGASSPDALKTMIEQKRKGGVFLSVLGFGLGNLNDHMMQTLAQNGNGTAAYIDNLNEARKVLVEEASSTLFPIAKDVKIQVEFNPATVAEYRLIGYETRALAREDFNNDAVDAGEIGAGHEVTAIYEITPVGGPVLVDESRYAAKPEAAKIEDAASFGDEYAFVKLRYKLPNEDVSKLLSTPVTKANESAVISDDVKWAVAVAGYAQLLKGGQYMAGFGYTDVLKLAQEAKGADADGYRAEFINMVKLTETLAK
jgi:Ca-activated chloride channel family protein